MLMSLSGRPPHHPAVWGRVALQGIWPYLTVGELQPWRGDYMRSLTSNRRADAIRALTDVGIDPVALGLPARRVGRPRKGEENRPTLPEDVVEAVELLLTRWSHRTIATATASDLALNEVGGWGLGEGSTTLERGILQYQGYTNDLILAALGEWRGRPPKGKRSGEMPLVPVAPGSPVPISPALLKLLVPKGASEEEAEDDEDSEAPPPRSPRPRSPRPVQQRQAAAPAVPAAPAKVPIGMEPWWTGGPPPAGPREDGHRAWVEWALNYYTVRLDLIRHGTLPKQDEERINTNVQAYSQALYRLDAADREALLREAERRGVRYFSLDAWEAAKKDAEARGIPMSWDVYATWAVQHQQRRSIYDGS